MIESISSGPATGRADARLTVSTNALDAACEGLQRAVHQGRNLLDHPGVVRGRAADVGDDELRTAVLQVADRWQWGLHVLIEDASSLLTALQTAARLYDEVERTTVPTAAHLAGWVR